jgi:hypothetical protein
MRGRIFHLEGAEHVTKFCHLTFDAAKLELNAKIESAIVVAVVFF